LLSGQSGYPFAEWFRIAPTSMSRRAARSSPWLANFEQGNALACVVMDFSSVVMFPNE
jgi:hypothetical protein